MTIIEFDGKRPKIGKSCYIDPSSIIIGDVTIKEKSSVWPNATIRGDLNSIQIGVETNIQDGCVIHTTKDEHTIIGNCVTLGHGAIAHACEIGNYVLVGMGATIMSFATVDDWSIVAAGSVVIEGTHLPSKTLVMGTPARIIKTLNLRHFDIIRNSLKAYGDLRDKYIKLKSGR